MDDRFTPRPIAGWFMVAAVASLLFMLIGCAVYAMQVYTDPTTLPLDQRAMFEAEPGWVTSALGLASVIGAIGAVMLVLRRNASVPLLLVSLLGAIVWVVGLLATPQLRDLLSTNEIAVVLVALALAWTIYWFARHSRQRGWLH
jgi:magnesium-transporting ATPase (P-type)